MRVKKREKNKTKQNTGLPPSHDVQLAVTGI